MVPTGNQRFMSWSWNNELGYCPSYLDVTIGPATTMIHTYVEMRIFGDVPGEINFTTTMTAKLIQY